jgi:hypothetical protein
VFVLLSGNGVLTKLGRFPNGNVTAPETPKIFLGNSVEIDVVHAGGDLCRFCAPVIKPRISKIVFRQYRPISAHFAHMEE